LIFSTSKHIFLNLLEYLCPHANSPHEHILLHEIHLQLPFSSVSLNLLFSCAILIANSNGLILGKSDLYSLFGFHSNSLISLFIFLIICSSFFLISEFFFLSYFSISCSHQSSIFCFLFLKRTEYLKSAFFFISSIFLSHFLVMLYLSFIEKNSVGKSQRIVNSTEFFFTVNYYLTLIFNFSRFFYENYKLTYNLFYINGNTASMFNSSSFWSIYDLLKLSLELINSPSFHFKTL